MIIRLIVLPDPYSGDFNMNYLSAQCFAYGKDGQLLVLSQDGRLYCVDGCRATILSSIVATSIENMRIQNMAVLSGSVIWNDGVRAIILHILNSF
jgi:hypothetical protein